MTTRALFSVFHDWTRAHALLQMIARVAAFALLAVAAAAPPGYNCPTFAPRPPPTEVSDLRPQDVSIVMSIGDSITAAFAVVRARCGLHALPSSCAALPIPCCVPCARVLCAAGGPADRVPRRELVYRLVVLATALWVWRFPVLWGPASRRHHSGCEVIVRNAWLANHAPLSCAIVRRWWPGKDDDAGLPAGLLAEAVRNVHDGPSARDSVRTS